MFRAGGTVLHESNPLAATCFYRWEGREAIRTLGTSQHAVTLNTTDVRNGFSALSKTS